MKRVWPLKFLDFNPTTHARAAGSEGCHGLGMDREDHRRRASRPRSLQSQLRTRRGRVTFPRRVSIHWASTQATRVLVSSPVRVGWGGIGTWPQGADTTGLHLGGQHPCGVGLILILGGDVFVGGADYLGGYLVAGHATLCLGNGLVGPGSIGSIKGLFRQLNRLIATIGTSVRPPRTGACPPPPPDRR